MSLSSTLRQSNPEALGLSQQAAEHLHKYANMGTSIVPIPILSQSESTEVWLAYEKLLLSCLRTGDDETAHLCLEKLVERFGPTSERVMGLRGLYQEAVASDDAALDKVLKEYNEVLADGPVNMQIAKRRIALFQSLSRHKDAIGALTELLESSPTDIEAWSELSDLYMSQNLFLQAAFCLEEALLVAPNAWNLHARLGEVLFLFATSDTAVSRSRTLAEAIRRFCRSVELCDDYLRGYYGLKIACDRLLDSDTGAKKDIALIEPANEDDDDVALIPTIVVRKLNERATSKLEEFVRHSSEKSLVRSGVAAAKVLLDQGTGIIQR